MSIFAEWFIIFVASVQFSYCFPTDEVDIKVNLELILLMNSPVIVNAESDHVVCLLLFIFFFHFC